MAFLPIVEHASSLVFPILAGEAMPHTRQTKGRAACKLLILITRHGFGTPTEKAGGGGARFAGNGVASIRVMRATVGI